jgi:hypothetical protein
LKIENYVELSNLENKGLKKDGNQWNEFSNIVYNLSKNIDILSEK